MTEQNLPAHEYLTVKELADLLRLKERKVYDLAASGAVPCSRATGKLLFPADKIRAWLGVATTGEAIGAPPKPRPPICLGSHDPLLDWAIRQSRCGLATFYDGSRDGLDRFVASEGVMAGLHIHDAASDRWNVPAVSQVASTQNGVLILFATRRRGLLFRHGDSGPTGLADLPGHRIVPRQAGSGTDSLFRELTSQSGLDLDALDFAPVARTEDEAAEALQRGEADTAFGLDTVARAYGLGFTPVLDEEFAVLFDRKAWFDGPVSTLMDFCTSQRFRDRAADCGGYDITRFGSVLWNA